MFTERAFTATEVPSPSTPPPANGKNVKLPGTIV
jgi:hypothetical protein